MDRPEIEFVRSLYESHNRRDADGWLAHFALDAEWLEVPTGDVYVGWEGQRQVLAKTEALAPDSQCTNVVVRGGPSIVVGEFEGTGTHMGTTATSDSDLPPTGTTLRIRFCDVHEIQDGLIARTHRYWDRMQFVEQLQP